MPPKKEKKNGLVFGDDILLVMSCYDVIQCFITLEKRRRKKVNRQSIKT